MDQNQDETAQPVALEIPYTDPDTVQDKDPGLIPQDPA